MTTRALAVSEIIEAVELALHNLAEKDTNTCWRGHTAHNLLDKAYCSPRSQSMAALIGLLYEDCRTYPSDECEPPVDERLESRCAREPRSRMRSVDRKRKCLRVGQTIHGGTLTLKSKQRRIPVDWT